MEAIAKANPQAVVMVTLYKPTAALVRALRKRARTRCSDPLAGGGDRLFQGWATPAASAFPRSCPTLERYRAGGQGLSAPGRQAGGYSYMGMEAYVTARVAVEAMKRAGGISPGKAGRRPEGLNQDIGGFRVRFTQPTTPAPASSN